MMLKPKLVRDLIPQVIKETEGFVPNYRILDDVEYSEALKAKLLEEATELKEAIPTPEKTKEELADVLEVLHAICHVTGIDMSSVEVLRLAKRAKRGGFEKRVYLTGKIK